MFRNQYIIIPEDKRSTVNPEKTFILTTFHGYNIYTHPVLEVVTRKIDKIQIALLGFIIDPFNPHRNNEEIIDDLAKRAQSENEFFSLTQGLSGRFVMLYSNANRTIATGDACHMRQMFFSNNRDEFFLTSSPMLYYSFFKSKPVVSREKMDIINHPDYRKKEGAWFGYEAIDDRMQKLLPNHHLDLSSIKVERTPIFALDELQTEDDVQRYSTTLLKGTFDAVVRRYKPIQPVTAGWDSRVLLAASREFKELIKYYIFGGTAKAQSDAGVASNLAKKLNLDFRPIENVPDKAGDEFVSILKQEHLHPVILPKTAHLEYHYKQGYPTDVINVNGNAAELVKNPYGHSEKKITLDMLYLFSGYYDKFPYFQKAINQWYPGAAEYARANKIYLLDLFYWEQRMGNWASIYPFQQDMALEEVSPFNNKNFVLALYKIKPQKRVHFDHYFFRRIMAELWPEVLSEPFNPDVKYQKIKKIMKSHTRMKYLIAKFKKKLSS